MQGDERKQQKKHKPQYSVMYEGKDTTLSCKDLTPGHTYSARVARRGPGGQSPWAGPTKVALPPLPPGVPGVPHSVGDAQQRGASLRWESPSHDGGASPDNYRLECSLAEGPTEWHQSYEGERCDCGVSDLAPATPYKFRVSAHNRAGVSRQNEQRPSRNLRPIVHDPFACLHCSPSCFAAC